MGAYVDAYAVCCLFFFRVANTLKELCTEHCMHPTALLHGRGEAKDSRVVGKRLEIDRSKRKKEKRVRNDVTCLM